MNRRTFLSGITIGGLIVVFAKKVTTNLAQAKESSISKIPQNSLIFYISPEGNDTWSGQQLTPDKINKNGPFATLKRAKYAIRELKDKQGGELIQPVTIFLRNGIYYLDEPLLLEAEDSGTEENPITFAAFDNEKPVISGGKQLTNWQQLNQTLWVTKLPEVKAGQWYFRQLRINNRWINRARYPKFDPNQPLTGGWLHAQWGGKSWEKGVFQVGVSLSHIGDQLEWNLTIPRVDKYRVWLSYKASKDLNEFATLGLKNNQLIVLENLPATEDKYQWIKSTTMPLSAGKQTLFWKNIKEGSLELDAICLTNDPYWNPQTDIRILNWTGRYEFKSPQPGKHLLIIQAEACNYSAGTNISIPKPDVPSSFEEIKIKPSQFPNWKNWEGAEVHIFPAWGWVNTILKVQGVDQEHSTLQINSAQDIRPGNRFFITNVREALDSPDEWYLDKKEGELIYWPAHSNFRNSEIVAPAIDRLIVLQGDFEHQKFVKYISFKGITFMDTNYTVFENHSDKNSPSISTSKAHINTRSNGYYTPADAALWLVATQHCKVEQCNFTHLGGYAIRLEQQSAQNQIIGNTMTQLGQGGIVLLGATETQPIHNLIAANDIKECGQIYKHVAGIYLTTGSHNSIIHNRIHKMPRYGISLKSYDENNASYNNLIEFNEIVDTNLETNDTGAIELLGRDKKNSGNIIRFNLIHNTPGIGTNSDDKILTPFMASGIFLDDSSSGTTIYGNIISGNGTGSLTLSNGKDNHCENNIFVVNHAPSQITVLRLNDFMKNNSFKHNIVICDNENGRIWQSVRNNWIDEILAECDFNLYWNSERLEPTTFKTKIPPTGSFLDWQAAGFDQHSQIVDPQLTYKDGMWQILPNSPALPMGFQLIPTESIGISGFNKTEAKIHLKTL